MNDVELAIRLTADASDAATAFDSAGSSALGMANDVETASRKADAAADKLGSVGESADEMASKSSKATGALGALSAGFELVGAEKYAESLQGAAMATDFLSGVGDSLNLVMELQIVQTARAKAAALAHAVVQRAQAAASKAMAAAQWLVNAAMAANPIGLVVVAVIALVAAVVLAYKRSERFREIVKAVMKVATTHIRFVIKVVMELVKWVRDDLPKVWERARDLVVSVAGRIRDGIAAAFDKVRDKVGDVVGFVLDKFRDAKAKLDTIAGNIRTAVTAPFDAVSSAVGKIIDLVQDLIDKIKDIDFPDLPDLNPFGKVLGRGTGTGTAAAGDTYITNNFDITGVYDSDDVVATITDLMNRHAIALGFTSA